MNKAPTSLSGLIPLASPLSAEELLGKHITLNRYEVTSKPVVARLYMDEGPGTLMVDCGQWVVQAEPLVKPLKSLSSYRYEAKSITGLLVASPQGYALTSPAE